MRTTSSVEALNSAVQRSFPDSPNIFNFIQNLRLFDSIKSSDLYQLTLQEISNNNVKKRRLEDQQRDEKIHMCSESLKNEDITVLDFLHLMSEKHIVIPSDGKLSVSHNQLAISILNLLCFC